MWPFNHELLLSKYIIVQANIIVKIINPSNLQKSICNNNFVQETLLLFFSLWDWDWVSFTMAQVSQNKGHLLPWVQRVGISSYQHPRWSITTEEASQEALQKHVKPLVMVGTDVWCSCVCEREWSVLGVRLICPVGQVLRGAGADTINLTLRADPAFPLQRNTGSIELMVGLYGNALSTKRFYASGSISCNMIAPWPPFISINQLVDTEPHWANLDLSQTFCSTKQ